MYQLRIRILAQQDTEDIFKYYGKISDRLAFKFLEVLYEQFEIILESPELFQLKYKSTRVRFLKKFPFGIHYRIVDESFIEILSIIHTSRNPEIWKKW